MLTKHSLKQYPNNPFYQYLVSQGTKGSAPKKTSRAYPVSGFYFMRSNWSEQAVFMPIKANSTKGEWHNNIDNGTFGLYAYGRNFMNDSGSYLYESDDPERKQWREWFKSTKAHQTLTLNDQNINLEAECLYWSASEAVTALVVENKSYENLSHRRTILFIDKEYFIIHDQAIGDAEGEVKIHFQLVPAPIQKDLSKGLVRTLFPSGPNLVVQSRALQGKTQLEMEDGWISYKQNIKEKRPAWSVKQNKIAKQNLEFLTTLQPLRSGEAKQDIEVSIVASDEGVTYHIKKGGTQRQVRLIYDKK
jgi:heparan-sulfate lyase